MRTAPIRSASPWRKPFTEWDRRPEDLKRGIIREAGARLLAEHGLDGMSLQALMRHTGIQRSFYHKYYVAKADLVEDIAGVYLGRVYDALDAAGLDEMAEGKRLGAMARILARTAHRWPNEHRALMMGLASLPVDARATLRMRIQWLHAGVADAVALRLPKLGPAAAAERAAQLMLLLAGPALWAAEGDERVVDAGADAAVAAVIGAKATGGAAEPAPS